jgi:hypothetical protein
MCRLYCRLRLEDGNSNNVRNVGNTVINIQISCYVPCDISAPCICSPLRICSFTVPMLHIYLPPPILALPFLIISFVSVAENYIVMSFIATCVSQVRNFNEISGSIEH